ncbi:hypothetical protein ACQ33O_09685 [Ferruginibacter sp. SUN002]|uniref:hypothetical protein n=1 Tax=Ferruginibacter sp. SUN002 TaxID=2937789 RepID=UPI003D35D60F
MKMALDEKVKLDSVEINNEFFYKISNVDAMRPFFMSIVSDSNHWMFISSNGGLTAGRKNSDYSLFPYYTDDKITESAEITGSKSIFKIIKNNNTFIWEPFSERFFGLYDITRNLYKNSFGNKIIFEEINHDLQLVFKYQWSFSNAYGFVKTSTLINLSTENQILTILDGIQNIVPYGVGSDLQNKVSNLADAYKKSELVKETGVGIFALSAIIVDKAEPSEALKANVVFSLGIDHPKYLLSSLQLKNFRAKKNLVEEEDIKGEKGAYFICSEIELIANAEKKWMIVANVNQTNTTIHQLSATIKTNKDFAKIIQDDIDLGTKHLIELNASADALQYTADDRKDARHFSNTLFNIMRGGIFDYNYQIEKQDFVQYLVKANSAVFTKNKNVIDKLSETFSLFELKNNLKKSDDKDFIRLSTEYLPLKFSRRHGDPSRPWNQFSINTRSEVDGSKILDYEGNWRDIFQNWEVLAHSYPEFIEGMIFKFLNASTFDGYNPYRVTKGGFDWETIEPDDPWSYIGYWGDHQVIYLLKFLEFIEHHQPNALNHLFEKDEFVYANVPYKIKSYEEILKNPKDTIVFDEELDKEIRKKVSENGADGALLTNQSNEIYHVNFIEKILAIVLAKLSNFIPEGGIWMNTQRPEWNDANNALVGNGVSMVTLYYLRRFLHFLKNIVENADLERVEISTELSDFFSEINDTFQQNQSVLSGKISDETRKKVLDGLGKSGSNFRDTIYKIGFSGNKSSVTLKELLHFIETANQFLEHSIKANKRNDGLYHAYNLMTIEKEGVSVSYLSEMLEGQVAVLSSGYLSASASLQVLDALRNSSLYREDQYSYILYPNKNLPKFLEKNNIPHEAVSKSELLQQLITEGNTQIIEKDIHGNYHFNGNFRNANDVKEALQKLRNHYQGVTKNESEKLVEIFEQVFNHKEFTGRSMTFYGYEGLGSIYWHMVSKLLLATQETCLRAIKEKADARIINRLIAHYYEINKGIGVHKSPELYGAFPTDPYSHTPFGKGAQQPGMTGQVKEDILARFGELGVFIEDGKLYFKPAMLKKSEFLSETKTIHFVDIFTKQQTIVLEKESLFFTYCQIPIIYKISEKEGLEISFNDGRKEALGTLSLDEKMSKSIFERRGQVTIIKVFVKEEKLL